MRLKQLQLNFVLKLQEKFEELEVKIQTIEIFSQNIIQYIYIHVHSSKTEVATSIIFNIFQGNFIKQEEGKRCPCYFVYHPVCRCFEKLLNC